MVARAWQHDDHTHRCLTCMSVELPQQRMSPAHWSMRFDERGDSNDHAARAFINGEESNRCFEALEGSPGWAFVWRLPPHGCDCGSAHVCVEWQVADVVVQPPSPRLMDGQLIGVK